MKKMLFAMLAIAGLLGSVAVASAQDYKTPYVTDKTVIIERDVRFSNLQPVSDGKFTLNEYNQAIGYGSYWSSWTLKGERISGAIWDRMGNENPAWDSDACVLKDPKAKIGIIAYSNGVVRELRKNCGQVTQFKDGVSMVIESVDDAVVSYYINTQGEKVFPHLTETLEKYPYNAHMCNIKEGRRAYYSNNARAWGFLNETGDVVIEPQFIAVRDFANGYALVIIRSSENGGYLAFIDTAGKEVCKVADGSFVGLSASGNISDVSANGVYAISDNRGNNTKYFSVKPHTQVHATGAGMGFVGGYAFMLPENASEERPEVFDKNFKKVGSWDFLCYDFAYRKPSFSPYDLLTVREEKVLNPDGKVILVAGSEGKIGDFCDEGYAPFSGVYDVNGQKVQMCGYCLPSGEIVLAFTKDLNDKSRYTKPLPPPPGPNPPPVPTPPPGPQPEPGTGTDTETGPIIRIPALYNVTVVAKPKEGGVVYGTGKFELGDTIRVTGKIAKDYTLVGIVAGKGLKKTKQSNRFVVQGDGKITCYFIPDEEETEPESELSKYQGSMPLPLYDGSVEDIPIWLEISKEKNIKSPYGENTYGYLAVIFNPSKQYHFRSGGEDSKDELFANMFMAPMLVTGIHENKETGKTYLMLKGGEVAAGNMFVKAVNEKSGKTNDLGTAMANLMLLFEGFREVKITPAKYRIEILDGKIGGESFTFGQLERLSVEEGWLPGGHEHFTTRKKGLFVMSKESGLKYDFLLGRKMTAASTAPQIWWYPTREFYPTGDDKGKFEKIVEKLGKNYREYISDIDKFKEYNFSDFVIDIENNVLKCNKQNK